ncbi:MAG: ATP-dependent RecD-like DNA helicase [Ignavibacteriales bacterium]|nr:ATP-dependent RecD-like DNA helicase [Ignavibacteriales bacterium]MCF8316961.1 ATP-dependent RecD-like DNA helicase [Ignavibacteriales bacterium]MCF8437770.1 ATP-dependent RecD-like DNA helicase [Ignavibacteriales bacterium]
MMDTIQGKILKIVFRNEENGYTVAKFKRDAFTIDTITGYIHDLNEGDEFELTGKWTIHSKFGKQFQVEKYNTVLPTSAIDIEKYLASRVFKGIGPAMAKKIVKSLGPDALLKIDGDINCLLDVPGFGQKRFADVSAQWEEQKKQRANLIFLQELGITHGTAGKILKQYGAAVKIVISDNPYKLIDDIYGIGFITADKIAEKLGFTHDDPRRIDAAVVYTLRSLSDEGHVCYPYDRLVTKSAATLGVFSEQITDSLKRLSYKGRVFIDENNFLTEDSGSNPVYLKGMEYAERVTAQKILLSTRSSDYFHDIKQFINKISDQTGITPADEQLKAILAAFEKNIVVITGGPGTGKTTIIRFIIDICEILEMQPMLAAPTGRAAKRLAEATGREAKTIHRLLEYSPLDGRFNKNEDNPLETDMLIVDEMSMVDIVLFSHLALALPEDARIILVGDADQLPSVGPGTVLKDIIDSGEVVSVKLEKIFRQEEQSSIVVNAHMINNGEMPATDQKLENNPDFFFGNVYDSNTVSEKIVNLVSKYLPQNYGFEPMADIQVLSPMYRGAAGVDNLNIRLQAAINPDGAEFRRGDRIFRVGDKVMQMRNNYDKDVYNGDIGKIAAYNKINQIVHVEFDEKNVFYKPEESDDLVLAYAVSIHKSQGSEYPVVVIPVLKEFSIMLQRKLIYTAVTRGKQKVFLLGDPAALQLAISNYRSGLRFSQLRERITGKVR